MSQKNGVEKKRGNRLGFLFFKIAVRIFGLRGAYGFLYFVCLYYLIVDREVVAASLAYSTRRFPDHGRLRRIADVYLLLISQGRNLIDRYALSAGYQDIDIEIIGYDAIQDILSDQHKGFILLTAHVGNWQVAMTALKKFDRNISLMMRPEDNSAVKKTLNIDQGNENISIIFTDDSLGGVFEAIRAINNGTLVSIMGDRTYGYSALEASFLGGSVQLPYGAFSIAAGVGCPVVVLLSARTGFKKYVVDMSHVIRLPKGTRAERDAGVKNAVQEFARILEEYIMINPFQWFVFRDIWKSNK
ncbi:MAG: lysophospholipid acyltransferase family protein [Nitrospirota bacterium]